MHSKKTHDRCVLDERTTRGALPIYRYCSSGEKAGCLLSCLHLTEKIRFYREYTRRPSVTDIMQMTRERGWTMSDEPHRANSTARSENINRDTKTDVAKEIEEHVAHWYRITTILQITLSPTRYDKYPSQLFIVLAGNLGWSITRYTPTKDRDTVNERQINIVYINIYIHTLQWDILTKTNFKSQWKRIGT